MGWEENLFFKEAVLRLCGTREMEKALGSLLEYINPFIPGSWLLFQVYEDSGRELRTIIKASPGRGEEVNQLFPSGLFVEAEEPSLSRNALSLVNSPGETERSMLLGLDIEPAPLLIMSLFSVDTNLPWGRLVLIASGKKIFKKKHSRRFELLRVPVSMGLARTLEYREVCRQRDTLENCRQSLERDHQPNNIVGEGLELVKNMILRVAHRESPVLFQGEAGVGKELLARFLHSHSPRKEKSFVAVKCSIISSQDVEKKFFGFEEQGEIEEGYFEQARGGTLYLDRVDALPLNIQGKLQQALHNGFITHIGGEKEISLDVRVLCSTRCSLKEQVAEGRFREDLWYRLTVFPVKVPPLRERPGDIPLLANYFLKMICGELNFPVPPLIGEESLEALKEYSWPGNSQELKNILERAMILYKGGPLEAGFLLAEPGKVSGMKPVLQLDELNRQHIEKVLEYTRGRVHGSRGAAALLGVNPSTLRHKMDRLGIPYGKSRKKEYFFSKTSQ